MPRKVGGRPSELCVVVLDGAGQSVTSRCLNEINNIFVFSIMKLEIIGRLENIALFSQIL
jgi:hypothetical protein